MPKPVHTAPMLLLVGLILLATLSACGKKPGMVDPPPDVVEDRFPRAYPDAATDPAGTVPPPSAKPPAIKSRQRPSFF
ncbi:MAG: hypothetical protein ABTQ34_09020 [Bdellovibrionales bacterium]